MEAGKHYGKFLPVDLKTLEVTRPAKPETKKPHEMGYDEFKKAYPAKRAVPSGYFHPTLMEGTAFHRWSSPSAATHAAYEHVVEQALAEGQTVPDSVLQATIVGQHYIAAHTPVEKLRPWTDRSYLNASKPGSSTSATPETADALRAQGYTISRVEYHKFDRDKMPQNIGDQTHTIPLCSHGNQQAYKKDGRWFYHSSDGQWNPTSENTQADLEYLIQNGVDVPADLRSQHYLGRI